MAKKREADNTGTWRDRVLGFERIAARDLHSHDGNWRVHPQFQQDALQGILAEIGIAGALLVYRSAAQGGALVTIDGHLRKALNPEQEWPCLVLDVDDAEAATLLATHDPIAAYAQADTAALTRLLAEVQSGEAGVQALLSQLAQDQGIVPPEPPGNGVTDGPEPELDRAEELRQQWGTEAGQVWQLGQHRILCADCLTMAHIERVLGDETPAMIFADPPYGVEIVATNGYVGGGEAYAIPFGGVKHRRPRIPVGGGQRHKDKTGHYPIEEWSQRRLGSANAAKPFGSQKARGSDGAAHVVDVGKYAPIIGDDSPQMAITAATMLLGLYPQAVQVWWGGNYYADALPASSCWLVWNKETTGNFADCELAWTNQPKAARLFTHRWNGMLRDSERERRWHPTQKPAALAAWVYETLGHHGDVVLDPFLGCGPTIIAGEQTGRRVYGCELSPEYVAITLERYHQLTGQTPVLLDP